MTDKELFNLWFAEYYPKMGGFESMKAMAYKAAWDAYQEGFIGGKEYTMQKVESLMDDRIAELGESK